MKTRRFALMTLLVVCMAFVLSIVPMSIITADAADEALQGTQLTASHAGQTLTTGEYYVAPGATLELRGGTAKSGLVISGTVTIHIPEGSTLKVYGGNASGTSGAGAGIEVTSGNTLFITGEGTLYATGGNGASGANGASGETANWVDDGTSYVPDGGYGGNGGGGAGAGIGSKGGNGGSHKGWTRGFNGGLSKETEKFVNINYSGPDGKAGGDGKSATACGTICIYADVDYTAKGGSGGTSGGSGGSAGSSDYESDNHWMRGLAGGAGGGGGGSGYPGADIGTGGGGGGAGGSAGGVGYAWSYRFLGAGGGGGGAGYRGGSGGTRGNYGDVPSCKKFQYYGGNERNSSSGSSAGSNSLTGASGGLGTKIKITDWDGDYWQWPYAGAGGKGGNAGDKSSTVTPVTLYEVKVSVENEIVQSFYASSAKDLPASYAIPEKTGYTFQGFFVGDVAYYDANGNKTEAASITGDTTLTAQFKVNEYTYTVVDDEGDASDEEGIKTYEDTIVLTTPTREDYLFRGWEIRAVSKSIHDGAYYTYNPLAVMRLLRSSGTVSEDLVTDINGVATTAGFEKIGQSITIYNLSADEGAELEIRARWKKNSFTVTFKDSDGSILGVTNGKYEEAMTAPVINPEQSDYYNYRFLYWKCNIDGKAYTADQLPLFGAFLEEYESTLGDKVYDDVTFTAVYEITEYKHQLHFVGSLGNTDDLNENKELVLKNGDTNVDVITNFKITRNDGVAALLLIPEYDESAFSIKQISINGKLVYTNGRSVIPAENSDLTVETLDGFDVTITGNDVAGDPLKILLDNLTTDKSTNTDGEVFVQIVYNMDQAIGGAYTFGFVTKTPTQTDEVTHGDRSEAYGTYDPNASNDTDAWRFNELLIHVDSAAIKVVIQATGKITIDDKQSFVYNSQQMVALDSSEINELIANALEYTYNGFAKKKDDTLIITWYDAAGNKLDQAPKDVGTYQIGITAEATDYYSAVEQEVRATFTITKYVINVSAGDQSFVFNDAAIQINTSASNATWTDANGNPIAADSFVTSELKLAGVQLIGGSYMNADEYDNVIKGVIELIGEASLDNYEIRYNDGKLTITKATNAWITLPTDKSVEYSGDNVAVGDADAKFGTVKVEYLVGYEKDEAGQDVPIWTTDAPKNAGEYPVRITVEGNDNYTGLEYDEITLVITKKRISAEGFTFDSIKKYYNGEAQIWTILKLDKDGKIESENEIWVVATDANASLMQYIEFVGVFYPDECINAGVYTVQAVLHVSDPNYTFVRVGENGEEEEVETWTYDNVQVEILKRKVNVYVEDQEAVYSGSEPAVGQGKNYISVELEDGTTPKFVSLDFFGGSIYVPASNYQSNVAYYQKTENGTYERAIVSEDDFIGENKPCYYVLRKLDPVEIIELIKEKGEIVGVYKLTADVSRVSKNYEILFVTEDATFTITKKSVQIPVFDSVEYNGTVQLPEISTDADYTIVTGGYENAGDHDLELALKDTHNYQWTIGSSANQTVVWTITPKAVTVILPDAKGEYVYDSFDEIEWVDDTYAWAEGLAPLAGDELVITFGFADGYQFNAGTHYSNVLSIGGADAGNYTVTVKHGTLNILKKTLTDEDLREYIEAVLKYYNGNEQSWGVNDFTVLEDLITITDVAGHGYTDANGKYDSEFTYHNEATKYFTNVTVALVDAQNYQLDTDAIVEIELKIAMAENSWTSGPKINASTIGNITHTATPLFGTEAQVVVKYFTDEACTEDKEITVGEMDANTTYYAQFSIVGDGKNYYDLVTVIDFRGGFITVIQPTVTLDGSVANKVTTITYDGKVHTFVVSAGEEYTVTFSPVENWKDVGTYEVTITLKGENYIWENGDKTALTYTLNIEKKALTLTAGVVNDASITYGDAAPEYTIDQNGLVSGETLEGLLEGAISDYITCTYKQGDDAKNYAIAIIEEIKNELTNYDVTLVNGTLVVNKLAVGYDDVPSSDDTTLEDLITNGPSFVYDTTSKEVIVGNLPDNIKDAIEVVITYKDSEGNKLDGKPTDAGEYTVEVEIKVKGDAKAENYDLPEGDEITLIIAKAQITITVGDQTRDYNGTDYDVEFPMSSEDKYSVEFVNGNAFEFDIFDLTIDTGDYINAKTYTEVISIQYAQSENYVVDVVKGDLTINKVNNSWETDLALKGEIVYDKNAVEIGQDFIGSDPKFGDSEMTYTFYEKVGETWQLLSGAPSQAGEYAVVANVPGTGNYEQLSGRVEFTINKATITINGLSFGDGTFTYDGQEHSIFVTGETSYLFTISYAGNAQVNAGTYPVVATFELADERNYVFEGESTKTADIIIKKVTVTITAYDNSSMYGNAINALTYTITFGSAAGAQDFYAADFGSVQLSTTATSSSGVGNYPITISYTQNANYDVEEKVGNYQIVKFTGNNIFDLSAENVNYLMDLIYSANATRGADTIEYTFSTSPDGPFTSERPVNVGTYYVMATVAGTENYDGASSAAIEFKINKATLSAIEIESIRYNADTATWTAVVTTTDGKSVDCVVTYLVGGNYLTDTSFTAPGEGTFTVTAVPAPESAHNYNNSEAVTLAKVYSVTFADKVENHEKQTSLADLTDVAFETQYRFEGQAATKPGKDPTVVGYTFRVWQLNNVDYSFASGVTSNITLYAAWTVKQYTLYFYNEVVTGSSIVNGVFQEGEVFASMLPMTYTIAYGETFNLAGVSQPTKADDVVYSYLFAYWANALRGEKYEDNVIVYGDMHFYAVYSSTQKAFTITYMVSVDGGAYKQFGDVVTLPYGSVLASLTEYAWFIGDAWYMDADRQIEAPDFVPAGNLTLYGAYVFDIGAGDVNADGTVDADDIVLFRQWIVGGYTMIEVEEGKEWDLVTGDGFDADYNRYFLVRVSDANCDDSGDIRDITTTRMALVGGYGYDCVSGRNSAAGVTGEAIVIAANYITEVSTSEAFLEALEKGGFIKLTENIEFSETVTISKDTVIYLNGYDLDMSANSARPFEMASNASLVIYANGATVKVGAWGLVNVPVGTDNVSIVLYGGDYKANTDNGSFIKPRGEGKISIELYDVTLTDDSPDGYAIHTGVYTGNDLSIKVNGGTYNTGVGFSLDGLGGNEYVFDGVTINAKYQGITAGGHDEHNYSSEKAAHVTVNNCTITVTADLAKNTDRAEMACVTAGYGAQVAVNNSTLTSNVHIASICSGSGISSITLTDCTINYSSEVPMFYEIDGSKVTVINTTEN